MTFLLLSHSPRAKSAENKGLAMHINAKSRPPADREICTINASWLIVLKTCVKNLIILSTASQISPDDVCLLLPGSVEQLRAIGQDDKIK